ncbi:MAG TPA: xanthine dehydrogenase family protein molybdopterin-binding subunit [Chloroflexota bacterium]|nr:xanthine dehydrogenase family protein molybdopterin-binding subunit [Chloroflexota bacterium]
MAIGQSVPLVDSRERVTGNVAYVLNLELPGMLHARFLRSPYAHARLVRVDTSRAERAPGVVAVLSRNDLLDEERFSPYYGAVIRDQTAVALDKVRFVGDPVAAVAATTEKQAEAALALIEVEYEELPAVFDPEAALAPDAPLVHEGPHRVLPSRPDVKARSAAGTNIVHLFTLRKGDIEQGFREADLIIENVYTSPPAEHVALEPHVAVAEVRDGKITVWTACQSPYLLQEQLAGLFRVPIADVRVIIQTLGGGYGGKMQASVAPAAALLAWKARRPVKLVLRREEDFLVGTQHAAKIRLKTGVKRDGTLVAQQAYCYFNTGPYATSTPNLITRGYAATGPYRVPHVYVDSYGVYTNVVPTEAFRGYGITQVAWAHESQMDAIADALGMDPLELRLKNVVRAGDTFATGERLPEMYYTELLQEAAARIGWGCSPLVERAGTKIRAKGISATIKGMATPTTSAATVKLNSDGSLNVLTSTVEMGQGAKTTLTQIAADEAGLPLARVRVSEPDTSATPFDTMTAASRSTYCMGTAIRLAVQDVKQQLVELAAQQLEAAAGDLVVAEGRVSVRGAPERSLSYSEIVRRSGRGTLTGEGTFIAATAGMNPETGQGAASAQWHPAVVACEVEVDTETGKVEVTRLHAGLYVGRLINPRMCELQVEGSMLFGLGQALFEEVLFDTDGRLVTPNLSDYMIPSFRDVPRQVTVHLLVPEGATEVHGIGETALPPVRPAIGNAISRAIGVRLFDLPLTPEKILRALKERAVHNAGARG